MVPKGWSEHTLDDLALVERGKFSVRPRNDPRYYGGDMPFVQTGDVTSSGTYLKSFSQTLNENGIGVSKVFPKNTILITIAANIGDTAITTFEVACPDSVVAIQPYKHVADVYWLKKYLETRKTDLDAQSTQNAQKNINLQVLKPLLILTPPYAEQKKIAQILLAWDKAISVTEKLLANSQQQKKALMQQLLTGKKRLLDENGTRFSETWKLYALSKLFQRVTTKNNGKSNNVVTISGQHGLIKQEDFFKKTVASDTLDGYFLLKKGQFAYNKSYSNGYPMGAIKRLNRYPEGVVTTLYICFELTTPQKSCGDYWEHYFESGLLNNSLSQIAHEGGRAHGLLNVKPSDFFSLKVAVPGFEEQQKIASVLSAADTEISTLEKKLACLKDEKKALMQQLLTGKRRVKVDEAVAV
ncbi:TPA: restriction endonuclease subunit S [Escherichia coli]|uniref:restriction endonuclease subunit S n=2 Tax=Escherichia coli TaxID=562 RepID=UPI0007A62468|nr:restriction endonuclease subunit S [Escherichia coli]RNL76524.1 restriction endonuclease subunit S [Citrobacter sp. MH181794]EEZ5990400.1 restriction endonuclease subunit S [Escherichia coli]EFB9713549.1 restriction endonuclease subunit S [Escherichia coli]EFI6313613.1 restriction endonuclease subunit S [Escherichia coli]EFN4178694.1 restriction endonuclease subunit S [Escherichia coli]